MKYFKMKWLDVVLIVFLVLISFLPNAVFAYQDIQAPAKSSEKYVVIKVDGVESERIRLTADSRRYEHKIHSGDNQLNIIQIDGETVKMVEASCPDQICVRSFPSISTDGEQIICLPYKVVVTIEGGERSEGDLDAF